MGNHLADNVDDDLVDAQNNEKSSFLVLEKAENCQNLTVQSKSSISMERRSAIVLQCYYYLQQSATICNDCGNLAKRQINQSLI